MSTKMMVAVVVALVALAGAAAQQIGWEEPQPGLLYGSMNPCAEYLRQQCSSPVATPWPYYYIPGRRAQMWQPISICQPLRQQCCMQLRQMAPHTRCQAICSIVQSVVQQQQQGAGGLYEPAVGLQSPMAVAQMAQNLPTMCGLYPMPSYCATPCAVSPMPMPMAGGY